MLYIKYEGKLINLDDNKKDIQIVFSFLNEAANWAYKSKKRIYGIIFSYLVVVLLLVSGSSYLFMLMISNDNKKEIELLNLSYDNNRLASGIDWLNLCISSKNKWHCSNALKMYSDEARRIPKNHSNKVISSLDYSVMKIDLVALLRTVKIDREQAIKNNKSFIEVMPLSYLFSFIALIVYSILFYFALIVYVKRGTPNNV